MGAQGALRQRLLAVALAAALTAGAAGCTVGGAPTGEPRRAPTPGAGIASVTPVPPTVEETAGPSPEPLAKVDIDAVLRHTQAFEDLGPRIAGGRAERRAAEYVADRLTEMGYTPAVETFRVPDGRSRNVIAVATGRDPRVLVLGAHLDTRPRTPGANDDAAGCAILLEVARILAAEQPTATVQLVFFGAEEYNDGRPRDHHRGSRYRVSEMSEAEIDDTIGMISVDVVGYGRRLHTRTMGVGPLTLARFVERRARALDIPISYARDPGPTGWSDHEAYERAGIPAVWLERVSDPAYHTMGDTTAHLSRRHLASAARLVLSTVRHIGPDEMDRIRD